MQFTNYFKKSSGKRVIVLLGALLLLLILLVGHVFFIFKGKEIVQEKLNSIQIESLEFEHEPNQLIVQIDADYAPEFLRAEIERRSDLDKSFFGKVPLAFENIFNWYVGKEPPEDRLVEVETSFHQSGVNTFKRLVEGQSDEAVMRFYLLEFVPAKNLEQAVQELSRLYYISSIGPNAVYHLFKTPNDPMYGQLWGMQKIGAPQAWDTTIGSQSIIVGVIDSGLDSSHPEFAGRVVPGYDFIQNDADPQDENSHGTHVAGTVGATGDNGIGVVGVNWDVKIMPLRICNAAGACNLAAAVNAINRGLNGGAKVFNMSLGGQGTCPSSLQAEINRANSQGAVVIVAAGNDSRDAGMYSPASCNGVLTVGATTQSDGRASFSNYGSVVDISAPGVAIVSSVPGGYKSNQGTSMASPHVAGAAALLLSANPSLSSQQVRDCLVQNADNTASSGQIGPRLNIFRAIQACRPNATPTVFQPTATSTLAPTTPTITPIPGTELTPTATPTATLIPTAIPTATPTIITTPTPTPITYYDCQYDPACVASGRSLQLCPLVCTAL